MNILSLFDGISCGYLALQRAGVRISSYSAFEIDPNAIKISENNFPDIKRYGDVFKGDFTKFKNTHLLMAGSPCTYWTIAKNHKAKQSKETTPDGEGWDLFQQFVRALKEIEPPYFLFENNHRISKEIVNAISAELGVEPILINSNLVSAQNRKRYYWTNIPNISQPEDEEILLKDIFEFDESLVKTDPRIKDTAVITPNYIKYDLSYKGHYSQQDRLYYLDGKAPTVPKSRTETKINILLSDDDITTYKKISPLEAERLQTLPDGYTDYVPKTRRFEAIGNGWTVDVIAHILRFIPKTQDDVVRLQLEIELAKSSDERKLMWQTSLDILNKTNEVGDL